VNARLKNLGVVVAVLGLVFVAGGVFAFTQVKAGSDSINAFSTEQNVTLSYNEDGDLVDRGQTEGAQAILSLLRDDWGYSVVDSDLNSDDPVINTATEYMFQMATISYHVLHGTQSVTLAEDTEYDGENFPAGTYDVAVDGRYWTDFDRSHPLDGPARGQAWSGTAHALIAELGVGAVTASTLQLGYGISALIVGLGGTFILLGAGLVWAVRPVAAAPAKAAAKAKK